MRRWTRWKTTKEEENANDSLEQFSIRRQSQLGRHKWKFPQQLLPTIPCHPDRSFNLPTITVRADRLPEKSYYVMSMDTCGDFVFERGRATKLYIPQTPVISLPIRELTQLNKQDNTNFNLLGGHDVEFGDVDMSVILCLNYL